MFDFIFDLLPDEPGEYLGFGITGTATYLYLDHKNVLNKDEKMKTKELKARLEKMAHTMRENSLSEEAINYLKSQAKAKI